MPSRTRKGTIPLLLVLLACVPGARAQDDTPPEEAGPEPVTTITICHATLDPDPPYVTLELGSGQAELHGGHPLDIIPAPAAGCPTEVSSGQAPSEDETPPAVGETPPAIDDEIPAAGEKGPAVDDKPSAVDDDPGAGRPSRARRGDQQSQSGSGEIPSSVAPAAAARIAPGARSRLPRTGWDPEQVALLGLSMLLAGLGVWYRWASDEMLAGAALAVRAPFRAASVRLPRMPLDRQTIEKRDFPIGRRGYEPEAVDEHLARLADELDALQRQSQRRSPESIAVVASQQVAAIVQAAETTAADLERQAADEAEQIRREAEAEARATRDGAIEASQAHVGRVGESVSHMLQRVDAMEAELGALVESLRTGANRLQADLTLLEGNMGELYGSAGADRTGARTNAVAESARSREVPAPAAPPEAPPAPEAAAVVEEAESPEPVEAPAPEPLAQAAAEPAGGGDEDVEGARLIALNMALNGTSREETDRYLAENFDLSDRQALLDEVYASIEG